MKSNNIKWLLVGSALLAVSLTALAREKSDNRNASRGNDRPAAAPQRQESNQPQPASPAEPAKSAEQSASTQQPSRPIQRPGQPAAAVREAHARPASPAARPARSSESRRLSAQTSLSSSQQTEKRDVSAEKTARRTSLPSVSRPADKKTLNRRSADSKTLSRPERSVPAESKPPADASSASSVRSQSRLNSQRRVVVANLSAGRNRRLTQSESSDEKETKSSADKNKPVRPQNAHSRLTLKSSEQKTDDRKENSGQQTNLVRAASERTNRRVVVSKIERPAFHESRESRTRSQPPSARPLAQAARSDSQSIVRADELSEPSRHQPDREARASLHNSRPSHKDRYDSKITITPEKKIVVVGDITPHRPRPYIPRRLHPDLVIVRSSPHWHNHGSYFSLTFSFNSCARLACVPYHSCWGLTYYYPRYHRRYVFVSIGGWWPCEYRYIRYYWYGCHPYYWYGPTVITPAPVIEQNTYNTYNYYGTADTDSSQKTSTAWKYPFGDSNYDVSGYIEKISAPDTPQFQTAADLCFDRAVNLFLAGKYADAAAQFREAVRISPDDIILPFTYSQALFADGDYAHAAAVLRSAVAAIPDDQLTIYYPRGLYEKEEVLQAQIEALEKAAQAEPFAADFHLLLGYQYIGIEKYDKAADHLKEAVKDPANQPAAQKLLDLLAQLQQPEDD